MTLRAFFQVFKKQKINSFIIKKVFKFKKYNPTKFDRVCIFKLRIVNKIKGKATNTLFKKLRLIIQGYNNNNKEVIFMQFPII